MTLIDKKILLDLTVKIVGNPDIHSYLYLMGLERFKPQEFHRTLLKPLDGIFVIKL